MLALLKMMNKSVSLTVILTAVITLLGASAPAADLEWSGTYRIEGVHIQNSELDGRNRKLDYGLHHLSLRPKIAAGDGINIYGQFEILSNSSYQDSQLGQFMGSGVGTDPSTDSSNSNTLSSNQKSDFFMVSQLYLSWVQEYGALLVGRAPLQFGLGMNYNSGKGLFDHWFDTRDMVGYKIVMGNLFLMPMYGKVAEKSLNTNEDVNDLMIQLQYDNPETDLEMGVFYRVRSSSDAGSDAPAQYIGGTGASTVATDYNELSVYAARDSERFRAAIEGSFLSGQIGLQTGALDKVNLNGFGLAGELEYRPDGSKWNYGMKLGMATGDDPATDNAYEGYVFDRNYEVAMLLFNRPLGRNDVLRTGAFGGGPTAGTPPNIDKPDVEAISNVIYFAPYFNYKWTDKLSWNGVLATGQLNTDPLLTGDVGKDLGFELDASLSYSPRKGIVWMNQLGMLFPGSAFDYNGDGPGFAYGIVSKAAISF